MSASCVGCAHLRAFKPRPDERARYGFGDKGWECRKLGWEGYCPDPATPPCGGILFAQGTSAFGQDPQGLEAKPAGPVSEGNAPEIPPLNHPHTPGEA